MNHQEYIELRETFGDNYLLYVLNLQDSSNLDSPLENFNETQLGVLQMLLQIRESNRPGARTPEGLIWGSRVSIDRYIEPAGSSLSNLLRVTTGGDLPVPRTSSDPVLNAILAVLPDVYPALLVPAETFGSGPHIGSVMWNHPAKETLQAAVLADPILAKLFTNHHEATGWRGSAYRSTGHGGDTQLWTFGDLQITSAHAWASLDTETPAIDQVADKVELSLATLRRAIQRKKATVPVRVGLTGILLPEATKKLDLGWAVLRPSNDRERKTAYAAGVEGKLQTSLPDGSIVAIDYAGDIVATMEMPYEIFIGEVALDEEWPAGLMNIQTALAEDIESLQLGLALSLTEDQPTLIALSWQLRIDPLAGRALPGWRDTKRLTNLMPRQLTEEQAENWKVWAQRIRKHRSPSIAVAVRRMLQAFSERYNAEDVLVDAVIVWENLFGASQETTLRISTALAWLLGEDAESRATLQKRYKELYGLRSNIVHGSPKVSVTRVNEASREAVGISMAALRKLFEHRVDLLAEKTSEARGNKLLLDLNPRAEPNSDLATLAGA